MAEEYLTRFSNIDDDDDSDIIDPENEETEEGFGDDEEIKGDEIMGEEEE